MLKFYFISAMDLDNHNYSQVSKDTLWPFTVLDFQRVNIAAMQGALSTKSDVAGASTTSKAIGGAMVGGVGGALAGAEIGATYGTAGGPWGAAIGGVVGAIGGAAMAYL